MPTIKPEIEIPNKCYELGPLTEHKCDFYDVTHISKSYCYVDIEGCKLFSKRIKNGERCKECLKSECK
jgi:hypothetical protein